MRIVTWSQAKAEGLSVYFTAEPCKYGHISERRTSGGACKECIKTTYKVAFNEYRRKNARRISRVKKDHERRGSGRLKHLARIRVKNALKFGRLTKQPCERCGLLVGVHAHHDDYSKPLEVMWLCPLHHRQRHKELDAINTKIEDREG